MNEPRRRYHYTYADYVALESVSAEKHEFLDGEIYVMAGGSEDHSKLSMNTAFALRSVVKEPCYVHGSDLRIYVELFGLATFPDASVICGPLQQHEPSPDATALNPTILVEVTSDSSEEYDTETKLEYYRTIPTLREYMIVSHRARRIAVHARESNGAWSSRVFDGANVEIPSLDAQLSLDEIYRGTTISAD